MKRTFLHGSSSLILFLVMVGTVLPGAQMTAHAQQTADLEQLEIAIWPEYDRPAVLVMMRAWLAPDTLLPATVVLPIPAAAGPPHAVAKRTTEGRLLLADHSIDTSGASPTIRVFTDTLEIRVEYYVPLDLSTDERRFLYDWPVGPQIANVSYEIQQPVGSDAFFITPPPANQITGSDGLTYHLGTLGASGANEPFQIEIAYVKGSPNLSAAAVQTTAPAQPQIVAPRPATSPPPAASTPAPASNNDTLLLVLLVAVVGLLIVIALLLATRSNKTG